MSSEILRVFPSDINTDEIISGKYKYDELDMNKLAVHTFESIDKNFYNDARSKKDPIIVAAKNFGCGSSREQAPQVLKACGISCIIAESFARIFYRNCFNIGLPAIECNDIAEKVSKGDKLEIDFESGTIKNLTKGDIYKFKPIPEYIRKILDAGGLIPFLKNNDGF
ncbi:MAG: 3-isopropylmalate dehydratase [Candidatus Methanoliparum thermophilum]|uniref:3-isopropylmalate dehydratase small subunit n=1 Tax=Methanoliparum thermophilum TaxID=2491083 RepID=A0A520KQI7_METT2|nr:hypothetical protein [Candidatus Methanoliparum sp. LAM-1]RZN63830.1 MAG: 3-isopropylmalate dehydratase [Candidatus Methanoliparum thermophilum]BDC36446.1 3-isopropylmalate dehydratase small subunit [Candidatus Methanoliparum sp. LAM-1]